MRIAVLADSLGLPRRLDNGLLTWELTWPFRLGVYLQDASGKCSVILNYARRLRTDDETLIDLEEYVFTRNPDILIIQVGICDCAPRIFSCRFQRLFLQNHAFHWRIRRFVIDIASRNRRWILQHLAPVVYLPIDLFRMSIELIVDRVKNKKTWNAPVFLCALSLCPQNMSTLSGSEPEFSRLQRRSVPGLSF